MPIPVFQPNHRPLRLFDYRAVQVAQGSNCGWAWGRMRRTWLMRNPSCHQCGLPATEVHHIVPRHVAPERTLDWSNLMSLCHKCHEDTHNAKPRF